MPHHGGRHWIAWSDVAAVEPLSTTFHWPIPARRVHFIALRDAAGELLTTIPVSTLATDRDTALQTIRERWAAATGRGD